MTHRDTEKTAPVDARSDAAVVWFTEEACRDVAVAGGKGASLARMTADGLPVPPGFVIPCPVTWRCSANRLHSSRENLEPTPTLDDGRADSLVTKVGPPESLCVFSL